MPPAERVLIRALPWLLGGALVAIPLLAVPQTAELLQRTTIHLSLLTAFGLGLTVSLSRPAGEPWFERSDASPRTRGFGAAAAVIAVVTFAVALVTMATSAALRYDVSLQYLQLLSAMDIAWVVTATYLGARWRWGTTAGWIAGIAIGVACVWSIWRYLDTVGFTEEGGWLVSGPELFRLVILFDLMAAAIAITLLILGVLHRYPTAQRRPQS